jgi:hypothetical protein
VRSLFARPENRAPAEPFGENTGRIGTPLHFEWLRKIILAVLLLNALDAAGTLFWVRRGHATEGNPLMAELVHYYPALFIVAKTSLVLLGCALLWRLRKRRFAVVSIFGAFLLYYWILLYHLRAVDLPALARFLSRAHN